MKDLKINWAFALPEVKDENIRKIISESLYKSYNVFPLYFEGGSKEPCDEYFWVHFKRTMKWFEILSESYPEDYIETLAYCMFNKICDETLESLIDIAEEIDNVLHDEIEEDSDLSHGDYVYSYTKISKNNYLYDLLEDQNYKLFEDIVLDIFLQYSNDCMTGELLDIEEYINEVSIVQFSKNMKHDLLFALHDYGIFTEPINKLIEDDYRLLDEDYIVDKWLPERGVYVVLHKGIAYIQ